jgi:hypothetical protein
MFSLAVSRVARVTIVKMTTSAASTSTTTRFSLLGGIRGRFFHASQAAHAKLNVEGLAEKVDLKGVNVLVRVDLNVPLAKVRTYYMTRSYVRTYIHTYIQRWKEVELGN